MPASIEVTKSHAEHQSEGKWIAWTKAHTPLKIGNRFIRATVPRS